jgi:hypothetical protein
MTITQRHMKGKKTAGNGMSNDMGMCATSSKLMSLVRC